MMISFILDTIQLEQSDSVQHLKSNRADVLKKYKRKIIKIEKCEKQKQKKEQKKKREQRK